MLIRKATLNDFDSINHLMEIADKIHREALPNLFIKPNGPARSYEYIKSIIDNEHQIILLAEENNKIIGLVNGYVAFSPPIPIMRSEKYAMIDNIVVSENFRKRGVGKMLFHEILKWFEDQKVMDIRLNVFEFNQGAIEFYERLGFINYSRRMMFHIPSI